MMIKNFIFTLSALFLVCVCSGALLADEYRILYGASDLTGYFCSFEPSESGDNPDAISVTNTKGRFYLFGKLSEAEWNLVTTMEAGTPINYDIEVINAYNEAGGEYETLVYVSKIIKMGDPQPGSCKSWD
jgi:hypothetical protein